MELWKYVLPATMWIDEEIAEVGGEPVMRVTAYEFMDPEQPIVNVINNGGFEEEKTGWLFHTNGSGSFAVTSPGYEGVYAATVNLQELGNNNQLYQYGIPLDPYSPYKLSFAARLDGGGSMGVRLIKHTSPYGSYGFGDYGIHISDHWQTLEFDFMTANFDAPVSDGRLMFWFTSVGRHQIDEVKLYRR
jgi:hypothetical protein